MVTTNYAFNRKLYSLKYLSKNDKFLKILWCIIILP
jgi:hypothetical protein